jgi:hypothetical protein
MTTSRLPARAALALPVALFVPLLMGADGNGCQPGSPFGSSGNDAAAPDGASAGDDASTADGGPVVCTPASCANEAMSEVAKLCSDGTTLTESLCADVDGRCQWTFPACPSDAGAQPDAAGDSCGPAPVCNLPDCMYGVIAQTDANGCPACGVCGPAPDAGSGSGTDASCDCGAPPPVAACPGGGGPSVTCESTSSTTCHWVVGSCSDAGAPCTASADCPSDQVCGFPESAGCSAQGACFAMQEVTCQAIALACACDGTEINVACNGLPSGYASKPYAHSGACN